MTHICCSSVVVVVVFIDKQEDKSSWTPSYTQLPNLVVNALRRLMNVYAYINITHGMFVRPHCLFEMFVKDQSERSPRLAHSLARANPPNPRS
jgi:hypothetical protein